MSSLQGLPFTRMKIKELEDQFNDLLEQHWKVEKKVDSMDNQLEIMDYRSDNLEEEVQALKVRHVEVRNHVNAIIKQVNDLTEWIKEHCLTLPTIPYRDNDSHNEIPVEQTLID